MALFGASAQAAIHLVLTTEEYPPYNMSDAQGHLVGISTEIVKILMDAAGVSYELHLYPWARAIAMARLEPDTCVFSMSRTPEREPLYQWIGPLVFNDWTLFARAGAQHPRQLEDTQAQLIGSYQGDAIVPYLQARGYQVDVAPNDDVNPKKLLAGRIDYWATGKLIGQYRLKQQKLSGIEAVLDFNRTEMYLACNRKLPAELVQQLNSLLNQMEKRGQIQHIYQEHGYSP